MRKLYERRGLVTVIVHEMSGDVILPLLSKFLCNRREYVGKFDSMYNSSTEIKNDASVSWCRA